MALTISDLVDELIEIQRSEKRPQRKIRALVRELSEETITGSLTVQSVAQTVAYTRVQELRDGNTIKCDLPETDYSLELQLHTDIKVQKGSTLTVSFELDKFDGYSRVVFAHQAGPFVPDTGKEDPAAQSDILPQDSESKPDLPASPPPSTAKHSPESADPLAAFRAEALATLSQTISFGTPDTTEDEARLKQLQEDSRKHLDELTRRADSLTTDFNREETVGKAVTASASDSPPSKDIAGNDSNNRSTKEPIPIATEPPDTTTGKTSIPNVDVKDDTLETKTAAKSDSQPLTAKPIEASKVADTHAPASDNLDALLRDALGESDKPVTLQLLSSIVSLQTGIPANVVAHAQQAMWSQLSTPNTFGEGKDTYRFPLLGTFQVRTNGGDISLDFYSNEIDTISNAEINENVDYSQAREYVKTNSGPLIARHAFTLALSTAAAIGIKKAHGYMTVYRTILLLLRIIGKGSRRIRIEEVGEFFPSIIVGAKAYRFRVYPTLLRATSSAFKDATVFLSKPGEAQARFENMAGTSSGNSTASNSSGVGCLLLAGILITVALVAIAVTITP